MNTFFQKNMEPNKKVRTIEILILILLIIGSIASFGWGVSKVNTPVEQLTYVRSVEMTRDTSLEDYDGEEKCDV